MERFLWALSNMDLYTSYELDLQSRLVTIHLAALEYLHAFGESAPKDVSCIQQALGRWQTVRKELEFLIFADILSDRLHALTYNYGPGRGGAR